MKKQTKEAIKQLKDKFVEYYADLPVTKYAAMYIGRDESTVHRWLDKDANFASRVNEARASWVKKKALRVRPDFALERLEKEIWAQRIEHKPDEDTIDKILKGFGLIDDGKTQSTQESPPQKSA